jgi:hypothetical protein
MWTLERALGRAAPLEHTYTHLAWTMIAAAEE